MRRVPVEDPSQVADVRRQASALAVSMGFDEVAAGRVAIVATELATNILRHGGGGEILLDRIEREGARVQLIALDRGQGIPDIATVLQDGYSTCGSAGNGLGAVRRLSASFDAYSRVRRGSAVLSEISAARDDGSAPGTFPSAGGISVPLHGEIVCGDGWRVRRVGERTLVMLVDGLGHGPGAADAAQSAIGAFVDHEGDDLETIVHAVHDAGRAGRGAAIGLLRIGERADLAEFVGIGNVESSLAAPGRKRMVSEPGIAGARIRHIRVYAYDPADYALAVLNSDGIAGNWSLDPYPGIADCHPSLIAAILYRDFARGRDDAAVVVVRLEAP